MAINDIHYTIIHRKVKYPRLEFKNGELVIILPEGEELGDLLEKHSKWIERKQKFIAECIEEASTKEIIHRSQEEFRNLISEKVKEITQELNLKINKILYRKMKTKWASMSPRKNLTINPLMKYLPEHLIEYILYHEITHLIQKHHNRNFWSIIEKKFNNYEELEKELFVYWFLVKARAEKGGY